jgi:type II secretory pathway pseudopilin PulG
MTVLGIVLVLVVVLAGAALITALLWVDYQDERAHRALDLARRQRGQHS